MKPPFPKRIIQLWLVIAIFVSTSGCEMKGGWSKALRVGMTVQDLSNPTWLGYCQAIQRVAEANGAEMSYNACDSCVATQISQIKGYIDDAVDVIIVHPANPTGIEAVCKQAREAGIKVIAWDDDIENADMRWLLNNYKVGFEVGKLAAEFIHEKHNGKADVAILTYPQLPVLFERGKGIKEALLAKAPEARIVVETSAINPKEGILKTQEIFRAHPLTKVICCIGGGGSVGANEAAIADGQVTDDFGIFAVDATKRELEAIMNDEGVRMSMIVTGTDQQVAAQIFSYAEKLAADKDVPKHVYRNVIPVTKSNVSLYYKGKLSN